MYCRKFLDSLIVLLVVYMIEEVAAIYSQKSDLVAKTSGTVRVFFINTDLPESKPIMERYGDWNVLSGRRLIRVCT